MVDTLDEMTAQVRGSWQRFLDVFEPLRPDLYRYCRHLTRSAWDAEDLSQDAMARAFVTLGTLFGEVPNPRAWLFRVASNLWIDQKRRARLQADDSRADLEMASHVSPSAQGLREAAGTLLVHLSPQERAAVVLKDVFDFSLDEVAEVLSTSVGAIKAALHRGRGKVISPEERESHGVKPAVLDEFCAAFNARDLDRLTALLLTTASVEIVGVVTEYGQDAPKHPSRGSFAGTMAPITYDERGGVRPEFLQGYRGGGPRCEGLVHRDVLLLLFWYDHDSGPAVRTIMTVQTEGDSIARIRNYFFSPDVIADICAELAVPYRTNGYRYW